MFRVSLANATVKRSLKPLHEKHQATPVAVALDADASVTENASIYSGMVAVWSDGTAGTVKRAADVSAERVIGLFALDKNATINDTENQPDDLQVGGASGAGYAFAIWQGGPDAYFEVTGDVCAADVFSASPGDALYPLDDGTLSATDTNTYGKSIGEIVEVDSSAEKAVIRIQLPSAP